jgi:glucosamine-6-phosphate deaminase
MMLIDSNIIIYAAKPEYDDLRMFITENSPAVSAISYVEVLGYHRLTEQELQHFEAFFSAATVLALSQTILDEAVKLRQVRKITLGDALVAATALVYNLTLVTRNIKDFEWIPNLSILNPLKNTSRSQKINSIRTIQFDQLPVAVYAGNEEMGRAAALDARDIIRAAIAERGSANVILATGNSQLTFLQALRQLDGIDWAKVTAFHMDEYLGIDPDHPASFPLFLQEHFFNYVQDGTFYPVPNNPDDVEQDCRDYEALLREHPADMVACGFGENGHLAFNDPPYAKFDDPVWVKVIELAEASRRQQVGEGHFKSLAEVPTHAITLTIPALLAPKHVLCLVPEARKAEAVRACLLESISEDRPGSILRQVTHARLYLDPESAAHLT